MSEAPLYGTIACLRGGGGGGGVWGRGGGRERDRERASERYCATWNVSLHGSLLGGVDWTLLCACTR